MSLFGKAKQKLAELEQSRSAHTNVTEMHSDLIASQESTGWNATRSGSRKFAKPSVRAIEADEATASARTNTVATTTVLL